MDFFVDIQGFRRSTNLFQLKELAIVPLENAFLPTICLFKAPCRWAKLLPQERKYNEWLEKYLGIPWNSDFIASSCQIRILHDNLRSASKIYVKGVEKKRWIEEILPGKLIINMEEIRCPPLRQLSTDHRISCHHHTIRENGMCAVKNAYSLRNWFLKRRNFQETHEGEDERHNTNRAGMRIFSASEKCCPFLLSALHY
ncbi:hypothetical protein QAD02_021126 [Eretmocerus hayati]|uniref:Uncharacterized protein n=1 Tax=Eretmocerus hayati TaxID=131215 RepID=A0ACC2PQP2_9HYME|nr:hypothetical protein QAD02_021126 [Eretmocerus hayati]